MEGMGRAGWVLLLVGALVGAGAVLLSKSHEAARLEELERRAARQDEEIAALKDRASSRPLEPGPDRPAPVEREADEFDRFRAELEAQRIKFEALEQHLKKEMGPTVFEQPPEVAADPVSLARLAEDSTVLRERRVWAIRTLARMDPAMAGAVRERLLASRDAADRALGGEVLLPRR
jgi:hypothetical protein